MQVSTAPKGQVFVRSLILRHKGFTSETDALAKASALWGSYLAPAIVKAAVDPLAGADFGEVAAVEFFDLVRERSLLGRLAGLRRVPFRVRMLATATGAVAAWVGEGEPKPLSNVDLNGSSLAPLKVEAAIVATQEGLDVGGRVAEMGLQRDLERALIDVLDGTLIDAANAGIAGTKPASVTSGAPSIAASGTTLAAMRTDLGTLIDLFGGDLNSAFFVTDPTTATHMGLLAEPMTVDVGARGGSLLGIPVLVTRSSPRSSSGGQLALVDPLGIAYGSDGIAVRKSSQATVQMDTAPDDPTTASTVLVSLWQRNLAAFDATVPTNWEVQIPGSVAYISSVNWGG